MAVLTDIAGIGPVLERELRARGIASVEALSMARPEDLHSVTGVGPRRAARMIEAARALSTGAAAPQPGGRRRKVSPEPAPSAPVGGADPNIDPVKDDGMSQPASGPASPPAPARPRRVPPVFFTHPGPLTWVTDLGEDLVTGGTRPVLTPQPAQADLPTDPPASDTREPQSMAGRSGNGRPLDMAPGRMMPPSDPVDLPPDPGPEELPQPSDPIPSPVTPPEMPDIAPPAEIPVGTPPELPQDLPSEPLPTPDPTPEPEIPETPEPDTPETPDPTPDDPPDPDPAPDAGAEDGPKKAGRKKTGKRKAHKKKKKKPGKP